MTLSFPSLSVRVRFSFFAVLVLMLLLRSRELALVCFLSALVHECGHLLLLRLFGARVRALTFSFGGIVIERENACLLPGKKEALAALGGVMANALLCFFALLFQKWLSEKTFAALLYANALLGGLNLMPVYPLDAWRMLHALLEGRLSPERLARVLRVLSLVFAGLFCAFCAFCCCKIGCNVSLLAVCVYLLLLNLKRSTSDV